MSEPIKHVDAFDNEVNIVDTIAFCHTKWQGNTRMAKAAVVGMPAKSFQIEVERYGEIAKASILKVKAVKL